MIISIVNNGDTSFKLFEDIKYRIRNTRIIVEYCIFELNTLLNSDFIIVCNDGNDLESFINYLDNICNKLRSYDYQGSIVIRNKVITGSSHQSSNISHHIAKILKDNNLHSLWNLITEDNNGSLVVQITPISRFKQSHINNLINFHKVFYPEVGILRSID